VIPVRRPFCLALACLFVVALSAQAPPGWKLRVDRSESAADPDAPGPIRFVPTGDGFHATNPQAAVFWNPDNTATGAYALRGTFTLNAPSNHTNYYGLVFGGSHLDDSAQEYVYFLVAQDGTWLVKRRRGDAVADTILPKTASAAVNKPDATGRSTNRLEVRVAPDVMQFLVNGTVVNTWLGSGRVVRGDGIFGIRVNHFLDVQIDGLSSGRLSTQPAPASGQTLAITGRVAQVTSPTSFALERGGVRTVVVAATLQRPVEPDAVVTVFGERTTVDRAAGVRATSVLTDALVDLTKRLPPPATADDEALDGIMKRVAPAFAALRQAIDGSNAAAGAENAATLAKAFEEVEAFWTAKAKADAIGWARDARQQSAAIRLAADTRNWDAAKGSLDTLGQRCQSCHTAYRETFADGTFRIKTSK
jgi:hypothetical protein